MTCIVGLTDRGRVYLGGDSAGTAGYSQIIRADKKVFLKGPFAYGFTTSFRMGQVIRYNFREPFAHVGCDPFEYLVGPFIHALRACLGAAGWKRTEHGVESGGTFLVGWRGGLYAVHSDFQVEQSVYPYNAVGCGADLALGSLWSTIGRGNVNRVTAALGAASAFSAGVAPPFEVVELA